MRILWSVQKSSQIEIFHQPWNKQISQNLCPPSGGEIGRSCEDDIIWREKCWLQTSPKQNASLKGKDLPPHQPSNTRIHGTGIFPYMNGWFVW